MKRSIAMILAAVLMLTMMFVLTGCGSDEKKEPATEAPTTQQNNANSGSAVSEADITFTYNGTVIALDSSFDEAVAALGDPEDIKSETSCHGEGDDKVYTYADFVLKSYPKDTDGKDHVLQILINKAGVPTSKGIEVGSAVTDVTAAYGDGYNKVGKFYSYSVGDDKQLRFAVENDVVTQIDYYYKAPAK